MGVLFTAGPVSLRRDQTRSTSVETSQRQGLTSDKPASVIVQRQAKEPLKQPSQTPGYRFNKDPYLQIYHLMVYLFHVSWSVRFSKKAAKAARKLPRAVQDRLKRLVVEIEHLGPVGGRSVQQGG